jgi:hypothetical protein
VICSCFVGFFHVFSRSPASFAFLSSSFFQLWQWLLRLPYVLSRPRPCPNYPVVSRPSTSSSSR